MQPKGLIKGDNCDGATKRIMLRPRSELRADDRRAEAVELNRVGATGTVARWVDQLAARIGHGRTDQRASRHRIGLANGPVHQYELVFLQLPYRMMVSHGCSCTEPFQVRTAP
jgi:hypothetical protein